MMDLQNEQNIYFSATFRMLSYIWGVSFVPTNVSAWALKINNLFTEEHVSRNLRIDLMHLWIWFMQLPSTLD